MCLLDKFFTVVALNKDPWEFVSLKVMFEYVLLLKCEHFWDWIFYWEAVMHVQRYKLVKKKNFKNINTLTHFQTENSMQETLRILDKMEYWKD